MSKKAGANRRQKKPQSRPTRQLIQRAEPRKVRPKPNYDYEAAVQKYREQELNQHHEHQEIPREEMLEKPKNQYEETKKPEFQEVKITEQKKFFADDSIAFSEMQP